MSYHQQSYQREVRPETNNEVLIAALIDYTAGQMEKIPALKCHWESDNKLIVKKEKLIVEKEKGYDPLVELLEKAKLPLSAEQIQSVIGYLRNTLGIVKERGKSAGKSGPKEGTAIYIFTLPSQDKGECLQLLRRQKNQKQVDDHNL